MFTIAYFNITKDFALCSKTHRDLSWQFVIQEVAVDIISFSYLYLNTTSHDFIKTHTWYNKIWYTVKEMLQHCVSFTEHCYFSTCMGFMYIPSFQQTWTLHLICTPLERFVIVLSWELKIVLIREHLAMLAH